MLQKQCNILSYNSNNSCLYDYGARFYDPQIGRFTTEDALAEQFEYMTPYQYASNNPIRYIDLDGLEGVDPPTPTQEANKPSLFEKAVNGWIQIFDNAGTAFNTLTGTNATTSEKRMTGFMLVTGMLLFPFESIMMDVPEFTSGSNADDAIKVVDNAASKGTKGKNLGNPFKGKTVEEVKDGFKKQVKSGKVEQKYEDPVSGSTSYKNKQSGYSYNVDTGVSGKTGKKGEKAHVDVNYPNPKPKNVKSKRKFDIEGD